MKIKLLTSAIVFALANSAAYAHHPAADNVDPEVYAMIDENVSDTPHADMTFDDMGGAMESREEMGSDASMESREELGADASMESREESGAGAYMESREDMGSSAYMEASEDMGSGANMETREEMGVTADNDRGPRSEDVGSISEINTDRSDVEAAINAPEPVDTFDLMDNVVSAFSD